MKEATITIKPYDHEAQDEVFSIMFYGSDITREDGLREIPAASYQLVLSALEMIKWECANKDEREALNSTANLVAHLRDMQKMRERKRKDSLLRSNSTRRV